MVFFREEPEGIVNVYLVMRELMGNADYAHCIVFIVQFSKTVSAKLAILLFKENALLYVLLNIFWINKHINAVHIAKNSEKFLLKVNAFVLQILKDQQMELVLDNAVVFNLEIKMDNVNVCKDIGKM